MTKDDFDALRKKIIGDLRKFEKRVPFEDFLEDFIQDLCLSLPSKRLKKVKATVEALYFEKNKAEKATTATKGKRTGGKVKLTVESDITNVEVGYELDDYDDFMWQCVYQHNSATAKVNVNVCYRVSPSSIKQSLTYIIIPAGSLLIQIRNVNYSNNFC